MILAMAFIIFTLILAVAMLGWVFYVLINDFEIFKISAKANHLDWENKYEKLEKDYATLEQRYNNLKKEMEERKCFGSVH